MRWVRLLSTILRAKFKSKIDANQMTSLNFYVWITDIDVSVMNHAALLTVMEVGRLDFMVRTGFFRVANKNKWFIPSQAISAQFYKPLKVFQKARLHSKISYVDNKWIYMEQKITRNNKDIAFCLTKSTIKNGKITVPTEVMVNELNLQNLPNEKDKLITTFEKECQQMFERKSLW